MIKGVLPALSNVKSRVENVKNITIEMYDNLSTRVK